MQRREPPALAATSRATKRGAPGKTSPLAVQGSGLELPLGQFQRLVVLGLVQAQVELELLRPCLCCHPVAWVWLPQVCLRA